MNGKNCTFPNKYFVFIPNNSYAAVRNNKSKKKEKRKNEKKREKIVGFLLEWAVIRRFAIKIIKRGQAVFRLYSKRNKILLKVH